jgi:LemA protein
MIYVIWGIVFVAGIWIISTYNNLTALRLRIDNAWRQIDVQLRRRYDLIPNLIETVKGYMQIEPEALRKIVDARSQAMGSKGVEDAAGAQTALIQSLGQVFASIEKFPELKSNQNVLNLQEELTGAESRIAAARQYYNDLVTQFNAKQQVFPANLIAGFFNFKASELFNAPETETPRPEVDLQKRS